MSNFINRRSAVTGLVAAAIGPLWSATARGSAIARGASTARTVTAADAAALEVLDDTARNLLQLFPESATSLGVDRGTDARLRRRLSDRSAAGQRAIAARLRRDLAKIEAIDPKPLSHSVKTSIEVVRSAYATSLEGFALPYGDITVGGWRNTPYVVIQNVGAYLDVPRFLDSDHPIDSPPDAEAYLERLRQYPLQLDGELERVRAARDMGLIPPAFLLDKTLAQLKLSAKSASEGGVLVDSLLRRTQGMRGQWERDARAIVTGEVIPALNRQINEIEAARKSATDDAGMWARPHGEQFYRWALKASTTTSMTPDEVHALGFEELERLHSQMDVIMRGLGFNSGSVGERMQAIAKDPRYQFAEGDAGRAEIMAFIDGRLRWIRKQMPRAFHTLVDPNMEVKRLPPEEEPGAPTAYGGAGSIDGRIPGKFWINLRTTGLHSRFALADLAFHESIPGHIWQGEYTHEMPRIRQLLAFNAYSEGWALYAQQLADELGAYENDPVGRLGYLQAISFRACRLVVDTGIHAKRWTREQGVRFFVERNGSNPLEVASEVDRYCSWPGQACGYKVGHSEINRQRDLARSKLGARFDVRDFNDTVLRGGNVPLDVLGSNVAEYVGSSSSD
ncbi:MAG: DUF885 domain-containing protein [Steroidobacteraceae bacterium]|jgi:uncharacterized protein (DUF885 family)|nr:DUF885 domain-containing protein [Gammaproteobacteria bacterium]